jgi:hypothetical protein
MSTRTYSRSLLTAVVAALALAWAVPAAAQEPAPPARAELPELNEALLVSFANAYLDVALIADRLAAAKAEVDDEEAERIDAAAREEMDGAVKGHGIEPELYHALVQALETDEALRERLEPILTRVKEERKAQEDPDRDS